jgi:F-type H+-transporting ATPase subunit epsilon
MAADKIELEIVTPKGRALSATADEVTAPSVSGEFGVMPGHLPLLAAVRTGLVTYRQGGETKKCAVGSGFAEAGSNKLLILTEEYIERDAIDPVQVRKQLTEVQTALEKLSPAADTRDDKVMAERRVLIEKENWLAAQLELYGDPPPPTMRPFEEWGPPDVVTDETETPGAGPKPS